MVQPQARGVLVLLLIHVLRMGAGIDLGRQSSISTKYVVAALFDVEVYSNAKRSM